jgi:hypothetical protein
MEYVLLIVAFAAFSGPLKRGQRPLATDPAMESTSRVVSSFTADPETVGSEVA